MNMNRFKLVPRAPFEVVLAGDTQVGKTCIINRLTLRRFTDDTQSTIHEKSKQHVIKHQKGDISFPIWDTATELSSTFSFGDSLLAHRIRLYPYAVILCFDITNRQTFLDLNEWVRNLKRFYAETFLVGNKCDLEDQRQVTKEEAEEFCKSHFSASYFETSAKTGAGITELFSKVSEIGIYQVADFIRRCPDTIYHANFDLLNNDFTFIVNNETFPSNKFLASLLSPVINNLLSTDKTIDSFVINTKSQGDFGIILDVFKYEEQEIDDEDKDFLYEILEILGNKYLRIDLSTNSTNVTYENVFSGLQDQLSHPLYYQEVIDKKIPVLSSNLYRILSNEEERQILSQLELEFIERILSDAKLVIESEDQLLDFINSLYQKNPHSSFLYEYVKFSNCSSQYILSFLATFPRENINDGIWNQITDGIKQLSENQNQCNQSNRYHRKEFPKGSEDFNGIINYLQKQTKTLIENEIKITDSSIYDNDVYSYDPYESIRYQTENFFCTKDIPNSWICFEFKNHQIIPTHYTIRSRKDGLCAPVNYTIEISDNSLTWYEIDTQNEDPFTDGNQATFTFAIAENKQKEAKYIRLTQTGKNSSGTDILSFESIEFYGNLK